MVITVVGGKNVFFFHLLYFLPSRYRKQVLRRKKMKCSCNKMIRQEGY